MSVDVLSFPSVSLFFYCVCSRTCGRGQQILLNNKQPQQDLLMDFLKKCCQCYWCSYAACNTAMCIDQWHSIEACGLAYLYCDACCWTLCAPLCIDCKLGETDKACENCTRGLKYCLFSCALSCVGCIDGCYNCFQIIKLACGEGVKGYADLTKNTEFVANKVKESLGLETGNEPMRSMATFTP